MKNFIYKELHGRQTQHAILASDSDDDEAEYLLGENGSQRNWIDLAAEPAITFDSVTIVLPDDPTRVLILNLSLQVIFIDIFQQKSIL